LYTPADDLEILKKPLIKGGEMKLHLGNQQPLSPRKTVTPKRRMQTRLQLLLKKTPQRPKLLLPKRSLKNPKRKKTTLKPTPIGSPARPNPISQSTKFENLINRNGKVQHLY
jgi:hypothetical protein